MHARTPIWRGQYRKRHTKAADPRSG